MKCAGAHPRFENEWHPRGCVARDLPPSAILEREPGRVRGLSGTQTVPLAACDSGSLRSANSGCPLGGDWSPKPVSRVRFLDGPPDLLRCGLLASQLRSERSPRRSDSCRLIQYTSRGLPASPLGFEPKARRFDSCLVFHLTGCSRGSFTRAGPCAGERAGDLRESVVHCCA